MLSGDEGFDTAVLQELGDLFGGLFGILAGGVAAYTDTFHGKTTASDGVLKGNNAKGVFKFLRKYLDIIRI